MILKIYLHKIFFYRIILLVLAMTINLAAGFQSTLEIQDSQGTVLFQKTCSSPREIKDFIQKNGKSKEGWSMIRGVIIPMRTQKLKDFSKDFFLPTFVNFSLKINNIALRVIASIFAIAVDIISFPIRLLTAPVRVYYNCKYPESEHPLINLIKNNSQFQKVLEDNIVNLCYEAENVQISEPSLPDEEGNTFQNASKSAVKGILQIALKSVPGGIANHFSEEGESVSYLGMNGEWTVENSIKGSSSYYS